MNTDELSDFPVFPTQFVDMTDLYKSFMECEELFKKIPEREFNHNRDLTFYKLLKEIHSVKSYKPAFFRKKDNTEQALILLWLSRVREIATVFSSYNNIPPFKGISTEILSNLAKLSVEPHNIIRLDQILLDYGIMLFYEPSIPGIKLDGVVFNMNSGNPVIGMSLRYSRLDNYWFTLMHELAHICLHYDRLSTPILDDIEHGMDELIEHEANRLGSNSLISRSEWRSCQAMYTQKENEVREFAAKVGVHPAIVAGRIHKELNRYNLFPKIVNEINVKALLLSNE